MATFKDVLRNTGLFQEPDGDLRGVFDLKASAKEAFLFASYGTLTTTCYYLNDHDGETLLEPVRDADAFQFPLLPVSLIETRALEQFYLQFAGGGGAVFPVGAMPLDLARKSPPLLSSILQEEKKLIKYMPLEYPSDASLGSAQGSIMAQFKRVREFVQSCHAMGIEPSRVLLVLKDPLDDEGFYEYLAGLHLRSQNCLVTGRSLGVGLNADVFGYRASRFKTGAFLLEVAFGLGDIMEAADGEIGVSTASCAIVEAEKTRQNAESSNEGIGQALRYMRSSNGYFGRAFVSGPYLEDLTTSSSPLDVGVVTFDQSGMIRTRDSPQNAAFNEDKTLAAATALLELARVHGRVSYDAGRGSIAIRVDGLPRFVGSQSGTHESASEEHNARAKVSSPGALGTQDVDDIPGAVKVRVTYSDGRVVWSGVVAKSTAKGIEAGTHKVDPGARVEYFDPSTPSPDDLL